MEMGSGRRMMSGFTYTQDQDNNWNGNQQYWPNANQGYWQPYQYAQPNYSWQPHDREPSLKDIVALLAQNNQMVQAQLETTKQLNQLVQRAEQQNKKFIEEAAADTKKLNLQIKKFLEAENKNEHEEFPIDMTNLELEELKTEMLRSEMELEERGEVYRFPEPITSARSVHNERSYELEPGTDTFTSARQSEHERSYEGDNLGLDTECFTSARNILNERSYELLQEGSETEKFTSAREDDDEYMCEVIKSWWEAEVVHSSPSVTTVMEDVFEEDLPLGALFADEEKDDEEVLEYVKLFDGSPVYNIQPAIDPFASPELERAKSSLEDLKMPELKPLPPDPLRYEFLYQTNAFPVYLFAGLLGLEVEEPHVKKKKKTGIGVRNREFIFVDHVKPYFQPQRRFIDMKLEVNRKEIIK